MESRSEGRMKTWHRVKNGCFGCDKTDSALCNTIGVLVSRCSGPSAKTELIENSKECVRLVVPLRVCVNKAIYVNVSLHILPLKSHVMRVHGSDEDWVYTTSGKVSMEIS